MFNAIFNTISNWAETLIDMIVTILNRIIKWIDDIIDWARKMVQGIITRIIFIITRKKLNEILAGLLQEGNIPTQKIAGLYGDDKKFEDGIVQVVHDTETNKIVASRYISGEGIDDDLKKAMRGTDILQLT